MKTSIEKMMRQTREAGGGTFRLFLRNGKPVRSASRGIPVLVPADMSDREITAQAELYAEDIS